MFADLLWEKNIIRYLKKVRLIRQANKTFVFSYLVSGDAKWVKECVQRVTLSQKEIGYVW
jgi:tRNA splicing endonuclease